MNTKLPSIAIYAILALIIGAPAYAADTDLFMTNNLANTSTPNVLFVIDNAASNDANLVDASCATSKKFAMEQCVIRNVLNSTLVGTNINIGLALFTPSGSTKGGYVNYAVRTMDATNKANLVTAINNIAKANNAPYATSLHEAYLYFTGAVPYAGTSTSLYDHAAVSGGRYVSPASSSCQKNYIIFIGNGGPDSSENGTAQTLLAGDKGVASSSLTPISLASCCNQYQQNWTDEFAQFLYGADVSSTIAGTQNIITYTIIVDDPTDVTNSAKGARALLTSAATQGGGKFYEAKDSASFTIALQDTLTEIQAVNSVFAAVTLPVSVNVRGTNLDQVYMGVFRPDSNALPRWMGNLKEYQLRVDATTNAPFLGDKDGALATNNATGFISPNAVSYWTSASTFWSFHPTGSGLDSDSPDGDIVEKGAAAQWLRTNFASSQTTRKLYTCTGSCTTASSLSATPFDTSNTAITQANTGTTSATDLQDVINWTRGQDIYDENGSGATSDVRASIHGDVLHSRPAVINYNRYADENDVFVFYGANDGIFHAIQGGKLGPTDSPSTRRGGIEQWGFIPSEFFPNLKSIRNDNVSVDLNTTHNPRSPDKPFFVDGPIGIYQLDNNNDGKITSGDGYGDKAYLYLSMRRGGRFVYALDVTDPAAPKYLWKRSNSNAGFAEMGQTWSMPRPVKVRAFTNPVVIMGGGYDTAAEDGADSVGEPTAQGTATMGRAIMVVDATDGTMLWQAGPSPSGATYNKTVAGMTYDIPADVLAVDRDNDGKVDRLYAVDTGGNIWRVDCDDANPNNWTVTKLASLRGAGGSANARKFLYAPDLVYVTNAADSGQSYDAFLIGSGDREHPFGTTVVDRFYMIKDTNTAKTINAGFTTIIESELYDTTSNLIQVGTSAQIASAQSALNAAKGWYVTLGSGEKTVGNPITVGGTAFFGTNQPQDPSAGVCTNLGVARLYTANFLNGAATIDNNNDGQKTTSDRSTTVPGGGFPPSPVPAVVLIDGRPVQVVISGTQVQTPPGTRLGQRFRTYWHNERDN